MNEHDKAFFDMLNKRNEEWKKKNNASKFKEGYEQIFKDVRTLQFMINHKIKNFKKENNCNLIINIVDGEIKIGALIDIDKI